MSTAQAVHYGLLRNALVCILPAVLLTGMVAQVSGGLLTLDESYLLKAFVIFAAGTILVLVGLPQHHPFQRFGAANQVTSARGALVAVLAALIGERTDTGSPTLATALATVVAILDGVDGWLARRTQMTSRFGARFDMETDAALIMVLSVLAWQFGKVGAWVLACGLIRYAFVLAGWVLPFLRQALPPSRRRKAIAVLQVVVLIVAVAPLIPPSWAAPIAGFGLMALTISFLLDVVWLAQHRPQELNAVDPR